MFCLWQIPLRFYKKSSNQQSDAILYYQVPGKVAVCVQKAQITFDEHGRQEAYGEHRGCEHACSEHGTDNPVSTSRL